MKFKLPINWKIVLSSLFSILYMINGWIATETLAIKSISSNGFISIFQNIISLNLYYSILLIISLCTMTFFYVLSYKLFLSSFFYSNKQKEIEIYQDINNSSMEFFLQHNNEVLINNVQRLINISYEITYKIFLDIIPSLFLSLFMFGIFIYNRQYYLLLLSLGLMASFSISYYFLGSLMDRIAKQLVTARNNKSFNISNFVKCISITRIMGIDNPIIIDDSISNFARMEQENYFISEGILFFIFGILNVIFTSLCLYFIWNIDDKLIIYRIFSRFLIAFAFRMNNIGRLMQLFTEKKNILNIFDKMNKDEYSGKPIESIEEISIKNLNFNFGEKRIFKDLNLEIKKGESLLVVGESGIGKSTLIKLILKLFRSEGIEIDGEKISEIDQRSIYKKASYITQKSDLLPISIRENILLGRKVAEEILDQACKKAEIYDVVQDLPDQYEFILNKNIDNISGGQARRLLIARSLIDDADLFLVDEATSGLDGINANKLIKTIIEICKNKILIMISHDLYCLDKFTKILYLKKDGEYTIGDKTILNDVY